LWSAVSCSMAQRALSGAALPNGAKAADKGEDTRCARFCFESRTAMQASGNNIESDVGFRQPPRSTRASNMNCSTGTRSSSQPSYIRKGGKPGPRYVSGLVRRSKSVARRSRAHCRISQIRPRLLKLA
jgi:hypothetical protein